MRVLQIGLVMALAIGVVVPNAQVPAVYDRGADGLMQVLGRLSTTASVLHIGAHPDDEDSGFLARTARGDHARVGYLSLNRGEGGQNIIGPELFEALGVIRTEELLQARRLDGAGQFFTRTFDYGFSKTRTEAAAKWDEREVLGDVVRVIRQFRPLVVYSRFTGTPTDGHGQHQMAGYVSPLAFAAAADPAAFPEQFAEGLRPWRAWKLYQGMFGGGGGGGGGGAPRGEDVLTVATGTLDPVIGRSYAQIAAEGRSQHKSQQMGTIEPLGPSSSGVRLLESRAQGSTPARSIFDGLDVSLRGLAALSGLPAGSLDADLTVLDAAVTQALADYRPLQPAAIVPALLRGLTATRHARTQLPSLAGPEAARADADGLLADKEREFEEALVRAAGVMIDPLADDETVVPGASVRVDVRTFAEPATVAKVTSTRLLAPAGWVVTPSPATGNQGGRETPTHIERYQVAVPPNAEPTQPYFLEEPRDGDRYRWSSTGPRSIPFGPALMSAEVLLEISGTPVRVLRPVQYRVGDRVRGELRRDIDVVPQVSVDLDSRLLIVPTGSAPSSQRIVARATSQSTRQLTGTLSLRMPAGWTVKPATATFTLTAKAEAATTEFTVTAPAGRRPGTVEIAAEAKVADASYTREMQTIAYPHIQTHRLYRPAVATVRIVDLKVASVHVGYIMGSGDQVPESLRRMGLEVTLLDAAQLAGTDLSRFDTIVVGIRASEVRPDFVANQRRLRDYMERGGTMIVQYQQTDYASRDLAPYPVTSNGQSRVTDELAPVTILAPTHQAFTYPNRIGPEDFAGWVQERDLYAFNTFDNRYTPLLESVDPGEMPQRGGELYARVGKGQYVYTSYAWFRQLPAGVPGAYRLFANLVSLSRTPVGNRAVTAPASGSNRPAVTSATTRRRGPG